MCELKTCFDTAQKPCTHVPFTRFNTHTQKKTTKGKKISQNNDHKRIEEKLFDDFFAPSCLNVTFDVFSFLFFLNYCLSAKTRWTFSLISTNPSEFIQFFSPSFLVSKLSITIHLQMWQYRSPQNSKPLNMYFLILIRRLTYEHVWMW